MSSWAMIFLMACFTLSEAMSSSATRLIDELKKYFSSNKPCGVCTYLLLVTREMVDGIERQVGYKFDRWLDAQPMQLLLPEGGPSED